jgi:hypothetical protein
MRSSPVGKGEGRKLIEMTNSSAVNLSQTHGGVNHRGTLTESGNSCPENELRRTVE